MIYQAVGELCAVSFQSLELQRLNQSFVTAEEAVKILQSEPLNFELVRRGFDTSALDPLRKLVGRSEYRRGARLSEAPRVFDCSSLAKWFFAQMGVLIPRRSIQQNCIGQLVTNEITYRLGDLVLSESSGRNYYNRDPSYGIGHVSIVSGHGTVFHAAKNGVTETDLFQVIGNRFERLRSVRRLIEDPRDFYVFRTNPYWEVESSDDIGWLIRQNLKEQKQKQSNAI